MRAAAHEHFLHSLQPLQKPVMAECAQLSQFDEELYKVTGAKASR